MRYVVLVIAVAACSGSATAPATTGGGSSNATPSTAPVFHASLPIVDDAAAIASADPAMPLVVLVDDSQLRVAQGPATWALLATTDLAPHAKSIDLAQLGPVVREASNSGVSAALTDLDSPQRHARIADQDDPPPPPPEDTPDDGVDNSAGSGSAAAKKPRQTIGWRPDSPHNMGLNGGFGSSANGTTGTGWGGLQRDPNIPTRQADVVGEVRTDGKLEAKQPAVVLAGPTVRAERVITVVGASRAVIGVLHDGAVRPLRLQFEPKTLDWPVEAEHWLEVRLDNTGATVEVVPDAPVAVPLVAGHIDRAALASAYTAEVKRRNRDPLEPVDVLVAADVDAQHLVDALVALEAAGAHLIGLGVAPTGNEIALRGHRIASVSLGQPNANGDLDKKVIRTEMRKHVDELRACYEAGLAGSPELGGTVGATFTIAASGKVTSASAMGVDPKVASCFAAALKKIVFARPKQGSVTVAYPFKLVRY